MSENGEAKKLKLATWCNGLQRSVLRQMISVVSQPGILSFAGGLPAPELFPAKEYEAALDYVLQNDGLSLQYRPPFTPLKRHVVDLMARRGITCTEDEIFFTTGAQQGLDILTRMLLNPNGQVLLEEIVYTGIKQVVNPLHPEILTMRTNLETGLEIDDVEKILESGKTPAFIYINPNAHNPLGVSLSQEKRVKLVEIARRYGVPILEDDPYGYLMYEENPNEKPCRALDPDWVFYLGSFSKILAPSIRIGWIVAPVSLIPTLTVIKEASDLECSSLTQRAVSAFFDSGVFPAHLQKLKVEYKRRRDAMFEALQKYFPKESKWTKPDSGMFIWVELPAYIDTTELLGVSLEKEKVAFIPGQAFASPKSPATNCLRLNFSNANPEIIEDGIHRLGQLIQSIIDQHNSK